MTMRGGGHRGIRRGTRANGLPVVATVGLLAISTPAAAATPMHIFGEDVGYIEILWFVALVGALCFTVVSAFVLLRGRRQAEENIARLERGIEDFRASVEQAEALLDTDDQRIVVWTRPGNPPTVVGRLSDDSGAPYAPSAFLAFGTWLAPTSAGALDTALDALRRDGERFALYLETQRGERIEVVGRISAGRAVVRFRDLSGEQRAHADLKRQHEELQERMETVWALLDLLPNPVWLRDTVGRLTWVNAAFARAVESTSSQGAVEAGTELLDVSTLREIARSHSEMQVYNRKMPVVVAGDRRAFSIVDVASATGSGGMAVDIDELEKTRTKLERTAEFHARTLDQLATAVAIFGQDQRLQFYNAAYRELWGLETSFLEAKPQEGAVLDQLRQARKLPEQADFRKWKQSALKAYQAVETQEDWWHLPDGRTLRVIANPHPQGGVTYIYENVTEQLDLQSRFNALSRVQGETLENLTEGVAVFGSDGRLRLWNPAFAGAWKLDPTRLGEKAHINDIVEWCQTQVRNPELWQTLSAAITGFAETRTSVGGRVERTDGAVFDFATVPLPDGATLATFVDVSDTVNVERALLEKNEALEEADQLKNAFIQHVSYELRSPLTNIIGFAELLSDAKTGDFNDKQREYTGYILSSSSALLTIINDILDLATVDAGIMELTLSDVDAGDTVASAVEGLQDRIRESRIVLNTRIAPDVGHFRADAARVRQVLYNLLSNAIQFSEAGGRVEIACERDEHGILFSVSDHGCGIAEDHLGSVFDRFVSHTTGSRRRGPGLGLSIVKSFVELHGGTVEIRSAEGEGVTVICTFPILAEDDPREDGSETDTGDPKEDGMRLAIARPSLPVRDVGIGPSSATLH